MVEPGGERTFVTSPGAEAALTPTALAAVSAGSGDTIYLSGYALLHDANRAALLAWLPGLPADARLVFDPGPLGAQVPAVALDHVERRADWWTGNAAEATALTGEAEPETAARVLARRTGRQGVLVRTGSDGCWLLAGSAPVNVPGFAVQVVDTTGAGDTHTGVFVAALAAGADPGTAARQANAAAALSVTRRGPATAPTAAELAAFLAGAGEPYVGW
jgi:sugar/nucleoside kinase (ribokinase family)